ncbi:hypothetical protein E4U26_007677, partial [Claviceps purpurea]
VGNAIFRPAPTFEGLAADIKRCLRNQEVNTMAQSDDPSTKEDSLTNTDHLLDEGIAKPRGEGSDFTFEEPICIDKKAPNVPRNSNYGAQPLPPKQERQKEKNLRGEFALAYRRTLSSPRIIWVEQLALMINTLRHLWTHCRLVERRVP